MAVLPLDSGKAEYGGRNMINTATQLMAERRLREMWRKGPRDRL